MGRGLEHFYRPGGARNAATALAHKGHIVLVTGYNVSEVTPGVGQPETDGPPSTAMLADACLRLGKRVTIITDEVNVPIVRAMLQVVGLRESQVPIRAFNAPHDRQQPQDAAQALLAQCDAADTAVVCIEVPGRGADGYRRNMRGIKIDKFNAALDELAMVASDSCMTTVSTLDGGNEVGGGNFPGQIPVSPFKGVPIASSTTVDHAITAFTSNFAALALAAYMLHDAGQLHELTTSEQHVQLILAALQAGAVDGVTRGNIAGATMVVHDRVYMTGVDGFPPAWHAEKHRQLIAAVAGTSHGIGPAGRTM